MSLDLQARLNRVRLNNILNNLVSGKPGARNEAKNILRNAYREGNVPSDEEFNKRINNVIKLPRKVASGPTRRNLLGQVLQPRSAPVLTIAAAPPEAAAEIASQMDPNTLARTILDIIKSGLKLPKPVAEAAATNLSQAPPSTLVQRVLDILRSSLGAGPSVNKETCPPDSIGDAYYLGRKAGCVFGTPTNPIFKLKSNGSNQTSFRGWKLVPRPTSNARMRFDFVKEEFSNKNKKPVDVLARQYLTNDLASAILAIIKGTLPSQVVDTAIKSVPQNKLQETIIALVKAALAGVKPQALTKAATDSKAAEAAGEAAAVAPAPVVSNAIIKSQSTKVTNTLLALIKAALAGVPSKDIHKEVKNSSSGNVVNRILALIKGSMIPTRTPGFLSRLTNFRIPFDLLGDIVINRPTGLPLIIHGFLVRWGRAVGYFYNDGNGRRRPLRLVHRRQGPALVDAETQTEAEPFQNANPVNRNEIADILRRLEELERRGGRAGTQGRAGAPGAPGKNANYENLRKKLANLQAKVVGQAEQEAAAQKSDCNKEVNNKLNRTKYDGLTPTEKGRLLARLLKMCPPGAPSREKIKTRIIEEIRAAGQNKNPEIGKRRIENLRRNLSPALSLRHNTDLLKALGLETGRAVENIRRQTAPRQYAANVNESRRRREKERNEFNRRLRLGELGERRRAGEFNRKLRANEVRFKMGEAGRRNQGPPPEGPQGFAPGAGVPPGMAGPASNAAYAAAALPPNQKTAITNAGGIQPALMTVASVPGGATEVAKAAEALNETGGNASRAMTVKGASPAAVQAVQRLGGPNNALNVLHGLNTISQKPSTIRRKVASITTKSGKIVHRRRRPSKIRIAELNRVINAVKKQKLISLVAHNVTKTHNIHPNDEKKKKYYKKVIKAEILRTKFAKIVKKASSKK